MGGEPDQVAAEATESEAAFIASDEEAADADAAADEGVAAAEAAEGAVDADAAEGAAGPSSQRVAEPQYECVARPPDAKRGRARRADDTTVFHANPIPYERFLRAVSQCRIAPHVGAVLTGACTQSDDFVIVQGPPGTGKTHALLNTLREHLEAHPDHRCIVCAPSNVGVANLHERALQMGIAGHLSLSRRYVPQGSVVCNRAPLHRSQVVFSTVCGRWSPKMSREGFDAVFVDEAAHCMEAHVWGLMDEAAFVCLVGDCAQLPAQVSRAGEPLRHARSMMERLVGNGYRATALTTQRRMDPEICAFPNRMFYDGAMVTDFGGTRMDAPYRVVHVDGRERRRGTSYHNTEEAREAARLARRELAHTDDVVVLVPYAAQQADVFRHDPKTAVHTIDSYQGREATVVILCVVRTAQEGFWSDAARLNVALTRARARLLVLLNAEAWSGGSATHVGALVDDARRRGVLDRA